MTANVLHIRSTIGCYGAEQVLLNVLPVLQTHVTVHLLTLESAHEQSGLLAQRAAESHLSVLRLRPRGRFDWHSVKQIRRYLIEHQITHVHSHDYKSLIHAYVASIGLSITRLHQLHGALGNTRAERCYARIESLFMRAMNRIIVVSAKQKASLQNRRWPFPAVDLVLNGTRLPSLENIEPRSPHNFSILMVARLSAEKNHALAFQAIQQLASHVSLELHIVGDGPLAPSLHALAQQLGIAERVFFHGFQTSTEPFYRHADVTLISSCTEGLPMTLLESLSYAVPVVSTGVGQIPQLLQPTQCGIIVDATVASMAAALQQLFHDHERRIAMGARGRQLIEAQHSVQQQAEHFNAIYQASSATTSDATRDDHTRKAGVRQ